jgi:hypothetical protein
MNQSRRHPIAETVGSLAFASAFAGPLEEEGVRWIRLREGHRVWTRRVGSGPDTGSHLTMWDDQQRYFSALIDFLKVSSARPTRVIARGSRVTQ